MNSPRCLLAILGVILLGAPLFGQAVASKEPTSTHIFPAGGQRGTTVPVRVGGECYPPAARFLLFGGGWSAPERLGPRARSRQEPSPRRLPLDANFINYPKEWESSLTLAADATLGPRFWRVSTDWGGTQVRPFLVGDLPEHIENEPNSDPVQAEKISLPVVVNGQIHGERDIDSYHFTGKAGQRVSCDVMAARLGSPLDAHLELRNGHGERLRGTTLTVGGDPVVSFLLPRDGEYMLQIAHIGLGGGPEYVYRMTLSNAPVPHGYFPAGGQAGTRLSFEAQSLGLPPFRESVIVPLGSSGVTWHRGWPLASSELPEVTQLENRSKAESQRLTLPVVVNGRFLRERAEHWYRMDLKANQAFTAWVEPFPPGAPILPILDIFDEHQRPLGRAKAADAPGRRIHLEARAPSQGPCYLRLMDQQSTRAGAEFIYRMTLRESRPDFSLVLTQDHLNLTQGTKSELEIQVRRSGGCTAAIDVEIHGLPVGVRALSTRIPENAERHRLILEADAEARPIDVSLRLVGRAVTGGPIGERIATTIPLGFEEEGRSVAAPPLPSLALTVAHKPVFRLTCSEAYEYAHRGTIYPYRMKVERLHGFQGPIHILLCDRQVQDLDGIEVVEQTLPTGATEFSNLIYFPESMHASVQHHSRPYVMGYATLLDAWGQPRTLMAISDRRCMVRTRPPVVKLVTPTEPFLLRPGIMALCPLSLERTANFRGPMHLELVDAPSGVSLDPQKRTIGAGLSQGYVGLWLDSRVNRLPEVLKIRATGVLSEGVQVVSEAEIHVKTVESPQSAGETRR